MCSIFLWKCSVTDPDSGSEATENPDPNCMRDADPKAKNNNADPETAKLTTCKFFLANKRRNLIYISLNLRGNSGDENYVRGFFAILLRIFGALIFLRSFSCGRWVARVECHVHTDGAGDRGQAGRVGGTHQGSRKQGNHRFKIWYYAHIKFLKSRYNENS